ncbi:MAG: histidine kinase [Boseongicola sp.]|nr:MAG: histidine kinase [Boseongicola sp.]
MSGKVVAMFLILVAIFGGGGMYYLQEYGFYEEVQATGTADVQMTTFATGTAEAILYDNFQAIDAGSSPIRYRACFTTPQSLAMMTETYEIYDDAIPTNAPGWFDCFDATAIGGALASGDAIAFLGTANVLYGIDRIVAVTTDGRGFAWHQINECGETVFDGKPAPEGCPPAPERTN